MPLLRPAARSSKTQDGDRSRDESPVEHRPRRMTLLLLFFLVLIVQSISPVIQVGDSRLSVPVALSLVEHGTLHLDAIAAQQHLSPGYDLISVNGHQAWLYPWPTALFAVPVVAVLRLVPGLDVDSLLRPGHTWLVEVPVASTLVALTTVVIFVIAFGQSSGSDTRRRRVALLAAGSFAFGTSAWSTASRALWQHGPSMLFISCALAVALRSRTDDRGIWRMGVLLALAYTVRPTNVVALLLLTGWVAARHPRRLPGYLLGVAAVGAVFVSVNLAVYGRLLPDYYLPGTSAQSRWSLPGAVGVLVSPSRGLLLYAPLVLLVPLGVVLRRRARAFDALDGVLLAILAMHYLLIASITVWWGGHAFGPRLFTDVLPLIIYFIIPVIDRLPVRPLPCREPVLMRRRTSKAVATGAVGLLLLMGVFINAQGALARPTWCWNADPNDIDTHTDRLWDWNDAQAVRGLRMLAKHPTAPQEVLVTRCEVPARSLS